MDVFECIRTRRSIRRYKEKAVDWDKIVNILESGKFAPNAGNLHNFKFIVVREFEQRKKLAEAAFNQTWMEKAPIHIVITSEPAKSQRFYGARGARLYTIQDCAAASENMLLAAHYLGLGSCWVGAFDEDKVRRAITLPETFMAHAIIVIGYADEEPEMPVKYRLEHVTFLDRWGQKKDLPFSSMGWLSSRWEKVAKDTARNVKRVIDKGRERIKDKYGKSNQNP